MEERQEEQLPKGCSQSSQEASHQRRSRLLRPPGATTAMAATAATSPVASHPRSRRSPGAPTTMAATPTTAGTAASPEAYHPPSRRRRRRRRRSSGATTTMAATTGSATSPESSLPRRLRRRRRPGPTTTMVATPSTAATAISPEMDALAREQIVQLRDALAREKMEKFEYRDALVREKLEKERLQRLLRTSMEELESEEEGRRDLMTTPERERAEMMDVEMRQQVEDEHEETSAFHYANYSSYSGSDFEYKCLDGDEVVDGAEDEQGTYFFAKEHSEVVCSDNSLCTRCLRIWCKLHGVLQAHQGN